MKLLEAIKTNFEEGESQQRDESRAHLVNVLLRSARRLVDSPKEEAANFLEEIESFILGLGQAQTTLEELHELTSDEESVSLELAHENLWKIEQAAERLRIPPLQVDHELVNSIALELREPVEALLSFTARVEESSRPNCRELLPHRVSESKPGELVCVPAMISRLLGLCHQVARDPIEKREWLEVLDELLTNYGKAYEKATHARNRAPAEERVYLEIMSSGLAKMIAGFERLKSFRVLHDAKHLDEGWVEMMDGLVRVRRSGEILNSLP